MKKNIQEKNKNNFDPKRLREIGKLGGRPKKMEARNKRIHLRFTDKEYTQILMKAKAKNIKPTDFCYLLIEGKDLPNFEQNKALIKFHNNFSHISNLFKMGIFNAEEKERFLSEIQNLMHQIQEKIKWL